MGTPAQQDSRDRFLLAVMRGIGRAKQAEEELLRTYSPLIRVRVERKLAREHAQHVPEVHQAALQRFRQKLLQEPAPPTPLLPFAYGAAKFAVMDFFQRLGRQQKFVSLDEQVDLPEPDSSDREFAGDREQLTAFFTWVDELGEPDKTIAFRCLGSGERSAEVASDLGMTENAVNKRRVKLNTSITELRVHG